MNILVVRLSSMGDIVMITPCLAALRRHWPQARITVAVNAEFAPLLACDPHVDGLVIRRQVGKVRRLKTARQAFLAGLSQIQPRVDLAIDLQGNAHSALWTRFSRARRKAGLYGADGGPPPRRHAVSLPVDLTRHAVDQAADLLERLGVPVPDRRPRLSIDPGDDAAVAASLADRGLPARGFLVIHPCTAWRSKEWPLDRYAEVIRAIANDADDRPAVFVTGSAEEAPRARLLCDLTAPERVVSFAGDLTLGQSLALWSRARLFLGADTGPTHASAALGVPTVALFGPTLPEVTGPRGDNVVILQTSRPARHTAYRTPEGVGHIEAIPVQAVVDRLTESLRRSARRG